MFTVCKYITLSYGSMPLRGKRSVVGSNFQELQMAPLLFTTGNKLQRPATQIQMFIFSNAELLSLHIT